MRHRRPIQPAAMLLSMTVPASGCGPRISLWQQIAAMWASIAYIRALNVMARRMRLPSADEMSRL